ncbi:hypothetical protein E2562_004143 [Oryza meyeriana var. granulata]|uniref:Uncharacterized protein n=1 Tax=Oryza meyeriana var. granulata TaxID=110450 RepID=A0A6G1EV77_9ORYZ|nr:hypothetical protein E2562_004143 [Oryza meyeriana var. granulata]
MGLGARQYGPTSGRGKGTQGKQDEKVTWGSLFKVELARPGQGFGMVGGEHAEVPGREAIWLGWMILT